MTQQDEQSFWEDLSREWHATPLSSASEAVLRARLKRQHLFQRINLVVEIAMCVLGLGIAIFATYKDLSRGVVALIFGLLTIALAVWARRGEVTGDLDTVAGMVDLSISRAERRLHYIDVSYLICALALVFMAVSIVIASVRPATTSIHREHAQWLIAGALTYIALFMVGAHLIRRRTQRMLKGLIQMRAALHSHNGPVPPE